MVTNAPLEFYYAKKKFDEAKSPEEKLKALYEMLKYAPKHKGSENLLEWIKKEIKKYKELVEKERKRRKGRGKPLIEKSGDILISILGVENSGKSYLLRKLTNAKVEISERPFTTVEPVTGICKYKGVLYQFVEIPATFDPEFRTIVSMSDYYILLLKPENLEEQIKRINEFTEGIVEFDLKEGENYSIIINKFNDFRNVNFEELLENILKKLKLIRVFPYNSDHAVVLREGSTVKDFIERINEKWLERFVYAKIERNGKRIRAGLNYLLQDFDVVELKLK